MYKKFTVGNSGSFAISVLLKLPNSKWQIWVSASVCPNFDISQYG